MTPNKAFQVSAINGYLSKRGINPEVVDVEAEVDPTLSIRENWDNLRPQVRALSSNEVLEKEEMGEFDRRKAGEKKPKKQQKPTVLEAVKELDSEYDVVTKEMVMDRAGIKDENHFDSVMALLKKEGEVYSVKQGQYKPAESRTAWDEKVAEVGKRLDKEDREFVATPNTTTGWPKHLRPLDQSKPVKVARRGMTRAHKPAKVRAHSRHKAHWHRRRGVDYYD